MCLPNQMQSLEEWLRDRSEFTPPPRPNTRMTEPSSYQLREGVIAQLESHNIKGANNTFWLEVGGGVGCQLLDEKSPAFFPARSGTSSAHSSTISSQAGYLHAMASQLAPSGCNLESPVLAARCFGGRRVEI